MLNINDLHPNVHTLVITHYISSTNCIRKFMQNSNNKMVFRSFALPLATFDYLKKFQRAYQVKHQVAINNNQALVLMLDEHQQHLGVSNYG